MSGSGAVSGHAKKRWSGSGARSGSVVERERNGERTKLAAQISLKGDMLLKLPNALQTLFYHVKNQLDLSTEILIPIGLFCFLIPNFGVFV